MLGIWLASIFSIFLTFPIYPILFVIFSFTSFYQMLIRGISLKNDVKIFLMIVLLLYLVTIIHLYFIEWSSQLSFIKIYINLIFLLSSFYFIRSNLNHIGNNIKIFIFLLELIIILSFIQVLFNVTLLDLWLYPFSDKITNSDQAQIIGSSAVIFGALSKNIWGTKIVLLAILYLSFINIHIKNMSKIKLAIFGIMIIFCTIYTFSRTAQAVLIIYMLMAFIYLLTKTMANKKFIFYYLFFIISAIPIVYFLFTNMLRIDIDHVFNFASGHGGDGFIARIIMWHDFFVNFNSFNIMGNGLMYAEEFLSNRPWAQFGGHFHNVFINTYVDIGIIGLLLYIILILNIFYFHIPKRNRRYIMFVMFPPLFVCLNSHYLGYDNDIIIYFVCTYLIGNLILSDYSNKQIH